MELSKEKASELTRRIMIARMHILAKNGFYGLLLMHMKICLDDEVKNAAIDDEYISFHPDFIDMITDRELEYCMMHLIMHLVLKHSERQGDYREAEYWRAADTVVNSNILKSNDMKKKSITLSSLDGVQIHKSPSGKEGFKYSVEELYQELSSIGDNGDPNQLSLLLLLGNQGQNQSNSQSENQDKENQYKQDQNDQRRNQDQNSWDDHSRIDYKSSNPLSSSKWQQRIKNAFEMMEQQEKIRGYDLIPEMAKRYLKALRNPKLDWRRILNDFVQEEINDYSFVPPDKRYGDLDFFLPDFNEKDDSVKNILFMVDTSGSMTDEEITDCFSEIKGAIEQYDGRLAGYLGFFDAMVWTPMPFAEVEDIESIRVRGGGGTNFYAIFEYVKKHMLEEPPTSIIILTDGYAEFPEEELSMDIPVLWVINNMERTPDWGRVARI